MNKTKYTVSSVYVIRKVQERKAERKAAIYENQTRKPDGIIDALFPFPDKPKRRHKLFGN